MSDNINQKLLARAKQFIPGGVNSPVRSFKAVGGTPIFISRAKDAYLYDSEDKEYLDMICSWGAMILGHGNEQAADILKKQALSGISFGAPTKAEIDIAELVSKIMPSMEMLRMVNSGTEATMSAIRLARGFTKRNKLIKFNGCYHGHSDGLLAQAGSGVLSMSNPSSPGVPPEMVKHTINLDFNDSEMLKAAFAEHADDLAAVIIEPIAGNMNMVPAAAGFLTGLRELCDAHQVVLIFDEVMTCFRVTLGGAQEIYGIKPDLSCLGKVIGGGLPVGAFGGRKEIMQCLAPVGDVYQAGTLSGNPVAVALGSWVLRTLSDQEHAIHQRLNKTGEQIVSLIEDIAKQKSIKICADNRGGMLGIYYGLDKPPTNLAESQSQDLDLFKKIFFHLLENGVHLPPSQYEACFISICHEDTEIAKLSSALSSFSP